MVTLQWAKQGFENSNQRPYPTAVRKAVYSLIGNAVVPPLMPYKRQMRFQDESRTMTQVGTPLFAAPELLADEAYSMAVDVWSFGCVLVHLANWMRRAEGTI